ncbi:MAG: S41 family peptidase [Elusimicrobia bacterium]|jgi:carboxyl-terminal processing protease|nr:S41 family peptidase [Elusimicrobiota bacterium]MBK7208654.1 S41 family peptidase [Elusimicrobiota bacterium]MBK7545397.1 S41 family peptidase [Elusimicrobiota bacterium]MBK7575586.1 S41 family peptidase [Elusimicrobiota bacterium]MBK7688496.1 S41 family peptidase [Elusimicrobiota bacterium]
MSRNKKWSGLVLAAGIVAGAWIAPARSAVEDGFRQIALLVDILQTIREQYVDDVEQKTVVYGAAAGMARVLDPFSQFMEPAALKEMRTETQGQFGGLGIRIAVRDNWLTVITPMPDTPAYRLGVLPGDKIIQIENTSTQGMGVEDAVNLLRGKPGTKVTVHIAREGDKEPRVFTITREIIKIQSVRSVLVEPAIGYIRLSEFIETSAADLGKALKELKAKGMRSLVLDLRNNPGGLLSSAVDVSKLFLADGKLIVYTQGRVQPRQDFLADSRAPFGDVPLAVLVNGGSASASEIVTGAVQDHRRGVIIGSETFGKGSVQSVIPLEDGSALRLTVAKYYTPAGRSIHRDEKTKAGGVTPDIVIAVSKETEAKLYAQADEIYSKDKAPRSVVKDEDRVKDEVLERAVQILKAEAVFHAGK